jgi:hypothetical protein
MAFAAARAAVNSRAEAQAREREQEKLKEELKKQVGRLDDEQRQSLIADLRKEPKTKYLAHMALGEFVRIFTSQRAVFV